MNSILLVLASCLALGLGLVQKPTARDLCLASCEGEDCLNVCDFLINTVEVRRQANAREERQALCFLPCDPLDAACIAFCGQKRQVDDLQSCLRYCNGDRACSARCEDAFSERVLRQALCFLPCALDDLACLDFCGGVGK